MIAPVPAPIAVVPTAPSAARSLTDCGAAPLPRTACAYCWHAAWSCWKASTLLPVPGIAGTAGPVGIVAQPPRNTAATARANAARRFIRPSLASNPSALRRLPLQRRRWLRRVRDDAHPRPGAALDVGVVPRGIRAIEPGHRGPCRDRGARRTAL